MNVRQDDTSKPHSPRDFFALGRAVVKPCVIAVIAALAASCGGSPEKASCSLSQLETDMTAMLQERVALAAANPGTEPYTPFDQPFSFVVERQDGRKYSFNWNSTLQTPYESASTSKLVSAVIIMRLVEQGYLKLTDRPQDRIGAEGWAVDAALSGITLDQLLSFTSGLEIDPQFDDQAMSCLDLPGFTSENYFQDCVHEIAVDNAGSPASPGQRFFYSGTHLQVAGLMAIRARDTSNPLLTWPDIVSEFQAQTGVFPTAEYSLPSKKNPRLAGGMVWNAEEYMTFLRKLSNGLLLNPDSMAQLLSDHTSSVPMTFSPIARIGEEWHYGYGLWIECESAEFNCNPQTSRVSSPGAWGSYPFWDRSKGYFGIVAREEKVDGSFPDGIAIERFIRPKVEEWVACD